jgi:hypothetical protein
VEIEALIQATVKTVAGRFSSGEANVRYYYQRQMAAEDRDLLRELLTNQGGEYKKVLIRHILEQSKGFKVFDRNCDTLSRGLGTEIRLKVSITGDTKGGMQGSAPTYPCIGCGHRSKFS